MKQIIVFSIIFFTTNVYSFPIPENNKVSFDIIRKNKTIGSVKTDFKIEDDQLIIDTSNIFSGFSHPAVITVVAVLIVSRALYNSGVVDLISRKIEIVFRQK